MPNFSERTARLHDMTHKSFIWDKSTWKHDYERIFEDFKQLLLDAVTLYYPDYDKPWILRVDASDLGVGFVLLQLHDDVLRPILFGSKKFSEQAMRWDTFNKEGYALYFGVKECENPGCSSMRSSPDTAFLMPKSLSSSLHVSSARRLGIP